MSRVLVTGASGALGGMVCRVLRQRGAWVRGVDKSFNQSDRLSIDEKQQVNLTSRNAALRAMQGIEVVIHCAAYHGFHLLHMPPEKLFYNNVVCDSQICHAASSCGVTRIVFTSSASIYGLSARSNGSLAWVTERWSVLPTDSYDHAKCVSESLFRALASESSADVVILRPTRFFEESGIDYHVRKLYRGIDIRDLAVAHVQAALDLPFGARSVKVFNLSAATPFTQGDSEALYYDAPSVVEKYYPGVQRLFNNNGWKLPQSIDRVFDIELARRELKFHPSHNFDQFLQEAGTSNGQRISL